MTTQQIATLYRVRYGSSLISYHILLCESGSYRFAYNRLVDSSEPQHPDPEAHALGYLSHYRTKGYFTRDRGVINANPQGGEL